MPKLKGNIPSLDAFIPTPQQKETPEVFNTRIEELSRHLKHAALTLIAPLIRQWLGSGQSAALCQDWLRVKGQCIEDPCCFQDIPDRWRIVLLPSLHVS